MQQRNIPIATLVDMYKRGELRLPEIQRHHVWQAKRVRDLLDSRYRGYPSGSTLTWETDEPVPPRGFATFNTRGNRFCGLHMCNTLALAENWSRTLPCAPLRP